MDMPDRHFVNLLYRLYNGTSVGLDGHIVYITKTSKLGYNSWTFFYTTYWTPQFLLFVVSWYRVLQLMLWPHN